MLDEIKNAMMFSMQDINRLTDFRTLAARLERALASDDDHVDVPARVSVIREDPFRAFDTMPAVSELLGLFVVKIGAVVTAGVAGDGSVSALVVAFCTRTGKPLAILDGDAVTQLKCAAVSALVTRRCAHPDAGVLAIIGSGVQAGLQAQAVCAVRSISEIRIHSPNVARRDAFAARLLTSGGGVCIRVFDTANAACHGAQVIATATTSTLPVISASAIDGHGWHINCVGNHLPESRELPLALLEASTLVVEDLQTAVAEAGPSHRHAMSLHGMLAAGAQELQGSNTIFASTGHASLDLHAVHYVLEQAGVLSAA